MRAKEAKKVRGTRIFDKKSMKYRSRLRGGFMNRFAMMWLMVLAYLAIFPLRSNAQPQQLFATIEGHVTDARTGEPVRGAHVFLSETKIGSVTNDAGRYRISRIPPGAYSIVISMIGYKRESREIVLEGGDRFRVNRGLTPVVYEMGEIYAGNLDDRWEKHLSRFERLFLGESELADSVQILNPEVLRFESKWWGKFEAEALAPLHIENRATGYHVTYYLEEFIHSGSRTRWTGDYFFREMRPKDSSEAERWKTNRLRAYEGSLRHFLLSLKQGEVSEEGFLVYRESRDIHGRYRRSTFRVRPDRILSDSAKRDFHHLNFGGRLEIIYTEQSEENRYVRWRREYRAPRSVQTSWLELNRKPVTIDPNGEIVETYGATRFGYHSFRRVAEQTPREYRPGE